MCKATVIYEEKLGKRREGWCVYLGKTRDFTFYSDKQIKAKIAQGEQINGLRIDENGNIVMDEAFTTSLLAKTGLATFTPILEDEDGTISNKYYALVRVIKSKAGSEYELVTNRCGLEVVTEDRLKTMLTLVPVGGVKLDSSGSLEVYEGIQGFTDTSTSKKNETKEMSKPTSQS